MTILLKHAGSVIVSIVLLTATSVLTKSCINYKYLAYKSSEQGEVAERLASTNNVVTDLHISGNIGQEDIQSVIELASTSDILTILDLSECDTELPHHAFAGCSYLKQIQLPIKSMTTIPHHCFSGCTSLRKVSLPHHCHKIEEQAFNNCTCLSEIHLPSAIEYIEKEAFKNCSSLKTIYCHSKTPPICNPSAFIGLNPNCKLIVPKGSSSFYKNSTEWELFGTIIDNIK